MFVVDIIIIIIINKNMNNTLAKMQSHVNSKVRFFNLFNLNVFFFEIKKKLFCNCLKKMMEYYKNEMLKRKTIKRYFIF